MADLSDLEAALVAAHEAGDTASAQRFAFAIAAKKKPVGAVEDVAKSVATAIPKGVASSWGLPADIVGGIGSAGEFLAAKAGGLFGVPEERFYGMGKPELPLPTSEMLRGAVDRAIPYTPQTTLGRRAGGVTEAVSGGVGLGGKAQAIPGLLSGLGMEGAGALSNDNQLARMAGAFLTPLGFGLHQAYRSTPGQMVKEATGNLTPQQIADAQAKMVQAKKYGIDLAGPEALPPSGIQQLMSDVAASPSGGRVVNEFMAKRPDQMRNAVESNVINRIPGGGPDQNMARARDVATDVISEAEKARTKTVRPYYQAAERDPVPGATVQQIVDAIDARLPMMSPQSQAAAEAFKKELNATAPLAGPLDDLYKVTRNSVELPAIGATSQQKTASAALKPFNAMLDDALKTSSPELKTGRQIYGQYTEDIINPLTSGPVGRVAGRQGFDPALPENLNPIAVIANEKVARPDSIKELYTALNAKDPQAFPGIAKTWLENSFDTAQQTVQAGKNRMVGANFAKSVYGTPQQQENFAEVMRGVAKASGSQNPDAFARGAKNLMEVLQLTGKVPGIGSPTGGRIAANEIASSSAAASVAESISTIPLSGIAQKLRKWAMSGNYEELARALTDPNAIQKIEQLGRYKPQTTTAQYFAAGVLGLTNERDR